MKTKEKRMKENRALEPMFSFLRRFLSVLELFTMMMRRNGGWRDGIQNGIFRSLSLSLFTHTPSVLGWWVWESENGGFLGLEGEREAQRRRKKETLGFNGCQSLVSVLSNNFCMCSVIYYNGNVQLIGGGMDQILCNQVYS